MELTGVFAAITTPFNPAGDLQLDRLNQNLAAYQRTSLAGYLVLGSSGEAICLDREEKIAVLREAAAAGRGKILLAGTAEESLRGTLDMTEQAAKFGYQAAVVRTPHYYKKAMTHAAFCAYYRELADRAALPILMYNIPPLTGVDLALDTILELAQHPRIVGLKESSGNMDKLVRLTAAQPRLAVLVGGASTLYPSLCAGASGAILALGAAAPEACCRIERAFRAGDAAGASQAQHAVLAALRAFEPHSIAGLKAAVDAGGYFGGPPRLPQLPVSDAARAAIHAAMAGLGQSSSAAR